LKSMKLLKTASLLGLGKSLPFILLPENTCSVNRNIILLRFN
jgi:hypothetical protein